MRMYPLSCVYICHHQEETCFLGDPTQLHEMPTNCILGHPQSLDLRPYMEQNPGISDLVTVVTLSPNMAKIYFIRFFPFVAC